MADSNAHVDWAKQVQEMLQALPDPVTFLANLFAWVPVPMQLYRKDGQSLLVNRAFRELFGAAPPPGYNIFVDENAARTGLVALARRAFAGEVIEVPLFWYEL